MVMTPITALEKPLFSGNAQCSKLNLPNAIHLILATFRLNPMTSKSWMRNLNQSQAIQSVGEVTQVKRRGLGFQFSAVLDDTFK